MISKKKIQLMTQDEIYMRNHYREDRIARKFFKTDYLASERLKNLIWYTIIFVACLIYRVVRDFYVYNVDMLNFNYEGFIIKTIVLYIVFAFVLAGITTLSARERYLKAKANMDAHDDLVEDICGF